jgi:hypothetical protein
MTESELRAVLALLAKDITLRTHNADGAVSMGSPTSIPYEMTVAPWEILSMHKPDIAEPEVRRFIIVKGKRLAEAAPTLPGKHYHSDDIKEPVFETDTKKSSLTYKDWKGDCEHLLVHTEEMGTRYKTFFEPQVDKRFKDAQITACVGSQYICINDLKTLGPAEWLNDTIIDQMTDVLASKSDTKSERRVAVFDAQFKNNHRKATK